MLGRKIAKILKIEYKENVLVKIKNNRMQSELNQEERRKNVKNVYKVKSKKDIQDKKILLIDDIFTTGYTADECARILCEANAKSVGIFTIAKD